MSNGIKAYEQATVSAEFLTRQLPCYSNGTSWNDFGCPAFSADDPAVLIDELKKAGMTVSLDQNRSLVLESEWLESPLVIDVSTIDVAGAAVEVYDFSFLGWTFDPCEPVTAPEIEPETGAVLGRGM